MPLLRRVSSALWALLPALAACSSTTDGEVDIPRPTLIAVGPEDFLDPLTCQDSGLVSYVVTLNDVDSKEDDAGVPLELPQVARSPRTPCAQTVVFGCPKNPECRAVSSSDFGIVLGRHYEAVIEGYDDETSDTPTWTTTCATVRAEFRQTRHPQCTVPLIPTDAPRGPGNIEVRLDAVLGDLICGSEAGTIERFTVYRDGAEAGSAACDEPVVVEGLEEGAVVSLEVLAFEAGAVEALAGTLCVGRAVANSTVSAPCDPLSTSGAIFFEVAAVAAATGVTCDDAGLAELRLEPSASVAAIPALTFPAAACSESARIPELAPGSYAFTASAVDAAGVAHTASCSAEVQPGLVSGLSCEPT